MLLISSSITLLFLCNDISGRDITQKKKEAILLTKDRYEIPSEGGGFQVEIKSNVSYQVTIDPACTDWITREPGSKGLTTSTETFTVAPGSVEGSREGTIVFSSGSLKDTVYVYQAQKEALVLTPRTINIDEQAQHFNVELRTNIEYEVLPEENNWLHQVNTKTLRVDRLTFSADENTGYDNRTVRVVVKELNSELSDTLTVTQSQKNALILSQKEYILDEKGGEIRVELKANIKYSIVPPANTWISPVETKALDTHYYTFSIDPNPSYDSREASIVIKANAPLTISDTLTIKQLSEKALILSQKKYNLYAPGGEIAVELKTNLEYDILLPQEAGWITEITTKGLNTYKHLFNIKANPDTSGRSANIIFKEKNTILQDTVVITQEGLPADRAALIEFYNTAGGANWTNRTGWCSDKPINEWYGVFTNAQGMVTSLSLSNNNLTGNVRLDGFKNMIRAYLNSNALTGIEITEAPRLKTLNLGQNSLSDISITGADSLGVLYCNNNQLAAVDHLFALPLLRQLIANNNLLTSLELKNHPNLTWLNIDYNKLTKLAITDCPLLGIPGTGYLQVFNAFDPAAANGSIHITIANCENLLQLLLEHRISIGSITIENCAKLNKLLFKELKLETLILKNLPALKELDCSSNLLKTLDLSSSCQSLERLLCNNNQLTNITFGHTSVLKEFNFQKNNLTTIDLKQHSQLERLICSYNSIALDVSGLTKLSTVSASGWTTDQRKITSFNASGCLALATVDISHNNLSSVNVNGCNNLEYLNCSVNDKLTALSINSPRLQTVACLSMNGLTSLTITDCPDLKDIQLPDNLEYLNLSESGISSLGYSSYDRNLSKLKTLNVHGCQKLQYLNIYTPLLQLLDVSGNKALTSIEASGIGSLNLAGCTGLERVVVSSSTLTALTCGDDLAALQKLHLSCPLLAEIHLGKLLNLKEIWISTPGSPQYRGPLESIDITRCPNLEKVTVTSTSLAAIELTRNTRLKEVDVSYNPNLLHLDASGLAGLTYLNVYGDEYTIPKNLLMDINVNGCSKLAKLYCGGYENLQTIYAAGCTELVSGGIHDYWNVPGVYITYSGYWTTDSKGNKVFKRVNIIR